MNFRGAIFDLDGTLLDSMGMWKNLALDYIKSLGIEPDEKIYTKLTGLTLFQAVEYFLELYGLKGTAQEHFQQIQNRVALFYQNDVSLKEGVWEFLKRIQKDGVKICLATATDERLMKPALQRTGILPFFSEIFTCSSVGSNKQTSTIYDIALAHLGINKKDTLVFEDAFYAAQTAKQAGYYVIGVADIYERREDDLKELCDLFTDNLNSLSEKSIDLIGKVR